MGFIVMGVSGGGKTTVGEKLARKLNLPFYDADNFHSKANIDKMAHGIPLTDADRHDWLATLATKLREWEQAGGAVLACSALKEKYRDTLQSQSQRPLHWVFLDGSKELLLERLGARKGHYMHSDMLDSQLAALEKPTYALQLSIENTPDELVDQVVVALEQDPAVGTKPTV
ncbi:gluconokinase [Hymenobacter terrenus]|uniref:gluconokinase n=1 Tax=Hymenobacter terrenus TaxID=1629124 RepID=UPI000619D74E|nr:gluconokinase [Hymenobacter terrenus]